MKIEQNIWIENKGWTKSLGENLSDWAQLVFVFGGRELLKNNTVIEEIKTAYPRAQLCGCSTAGEISGCEVHDNTITATAAAFEKSHIQCFEIEIAKAEDSFVTAQKLAERIDKNGLIHVFIISEGLIINGSELVRGLVSKLPENVKVTGGLAGDGIGFKETLQLFGTTVNKNRIIAIAFYGSELKIGYGSVGGWDTFGPERIITRSKGNILYEMDGKPALDLYKEYLGEYANGLPATGLLFPLSVKDQNGNTLVRSFLAMDSENNPIFAGDVPQGSQARLMKSNSDRLIDGAIQAAANSIKSFDSSHVELAILISCVGRKVILKQRIEEEIEEIQNLLGKTTFLTGFYSYGEIAPTGPNADCALHNQTMTITTFSEN
ncbi:MAG: FIST N-terminal domain-containing protein [Phycisphaerales bacterium]